MILSAALSRMASGGGYIKCYLLTSGSSATFSRSSLSDPVGPAFAVCKGPGGNGGTRVLSTAEGRGAGGGGGCRYKAYADLAASYTYTVGTASGTATTFDDMTAGSGADASTTTGGAGGTSSGGDGGESGGAGGNGGSGAGNGVAGTTPTNGDPGGDGGVAGGGKGGGGGGGGSGGVPGWPKGGRGGKGGVANALVSNAVGEGTNNGFNIDGVGYGNGGGGGGGGDTFTGAPGTGQPGVIMIFYLSSTP